MPAAEFLRTKLSGPRFDGGTVPLEVLKDLAILQELVLEVAKSHFLTSNPHRVRVPKGFAISLSLNLSRMERGSPAPVIEIHAAQPQSTRFVNDLPYRNFFESARDSILDAIKAAELDQLPESDLDRKHYSYFGRLGQSLQSNESIEFISPDTDSGPKLTTEIRRRLSRKSTYSVNFKQETTLIGFVPAMDQADKTFELKLMDGTRVKGPIPDEHLEGLLQAFSDFAKSDPNAVRVRGVATLDWNNKPLSIESVSDVTPLDPLDITARMEQLKLVLDGWYDGAGKGLNPAALDWLASCLEPLFGDDAPLPHLYPSPSGAVLAEWSIGSNEISFEINLEERRGNWHVTDLPAKSSHERAINLEDPRELTWLVTQLTELPRE